MVLFDLFFISGGLFTQPHNEANHHRSDEFRGLSPR